jgi:hypothetical protein
VGIQASAIAPRIYKKRLNMVAPEEGMNSKVEERNKINLSYHYASVIIA